MNSVLKIVLSLSLSGSLLILLLILLLFLGKIFLRDKTSRRWQYYIWLVVIARLLLPFTPEVSAVGMLFQQAEQTIFQNEYEPTPTSEAYVNPAPEFTYKPIESAQPNQESNLPTINWSFNENFEEPKEPAAPLTKLNPNIYSTIYTYKEISTAKGLHEANLLISLSDLIDKCEGISFQYYIEKISQILESHDIKYIDLSSIVRMLKLRPDLIFPFKILMHRIVSVKKVKYCVGYARISDMNGIFPLCFSQEFTVDKDEDLPEVADEKPTIIDVNNVTTLASGICEQLRGHDAFKADFQHNSLKFSFLNGMGERKILRLCPPGGRADGNSPSPPATEKQAVPVQIPKTLAGSVR